MIVVKDFDNTSLEDKQLAVRIPKHLKDFIADYALREGKTQQDLVIKWLSELKRDHARGNPVALITQYVDPNYHLTPQLMESLNQHIRHFQLTSKERLKEEAMQHYKLWVYASAYFNLEKDRESTHFIGLMSAESTAGICVATMGEACKHG